MTPQELKNSILQLAIEGKLVPQRPEEGTAEELYRQIQAEKQALIKAGKIKKESPLPEITEDEKPFDIPESWKWCRIGEISESNIGLTYKPSDIVESGGTLVLRSSNIQNNEMAYYDNVFVSCPIPESSHINKGDLLICARNGSRSLVGKCAIVDRDGCAFGAFMAKIKSPYVTYIKLFLDSPVFRSQLDGVKTETINQITQSNLKNQVIPLPPLAEQKRIVAKIEELLPLIDRYEEAWTKLEAFNKRFPGDLQKSLLQMAIQGKLVPQIPEEGTGEELYAQIQTEKQSLIKSGKLKKEKPLPEITDDEKPFDIPESWKWCCVGDVCTNIQYGTSNKSSISGKVAVLRMGNIQNGKIDYEKLVFSSDEDEIEKYCLEYDDLLFNRTNSKELVGKTAIYKAEMPAIYAGYLVRITPLQMSSDYLNYVMQSQYYWSYCQSVRSDAIGQSNINAEKLKRFVFPLPPLIEQKRIVAKLEELLPLCEKLK